MTTGKNVQKNKFIFS